MPYIQIVTSKELAPTTKINIKSKIGKIIDTIPGKTESVLMIGFFDKTELFYGGESKENAAMVSVNLHGSSGLPEKEALTEKLFLLMEKELDIVKEDMFLTINEYPNWGFQGKLV
jgi:hypothetical protein